MNPHAVVVLPEGSSSSIVAGAAALDMFAALAARLVLSDVPTPVVCAALRDPTTDHGLPAVWPHGLRSRDPLARRHLDHLDVVARAAKAWSRHDILRLARVGAREVDVLPPDVARAVAEDDAAAWAGLDEARPDWRATLRDDVSALAARKRLTHMARLCDLTPPLSLRLAARAPAGSLARLAPVVATAPPCVVGALLAHALAPVEPWARPGWARDLARETGERRAAWRASLLEAEMRRLGHTTTLPRGHAPLLRRGLGVTSSPRALRRVASAQDVEAAVLKRAGFRRGMARRGFQPTLDAHWRETARRVDVEWAWDGAASWTPWSLRFDALTAVSQAPVFSPAV